MLNAIIQARLSSTRLPRKVLLGVHGRPMLDYVVERVRRAQSVDTVILATSVESSDDDLAAYTDSRGLSCVRGALDDVSNRFAEALRRHPCEGFFRVNGDSPWADSGLLDRAADIFRRNACDLVTNLAPRTYPYGVSVELIRTAAFDRALPHMLEPRYREHITSYFYEHADEFRIAAIETMDPPLADRHLTVDTREDLDRFRAVTQGHGLACVAWNLQQVLSAYERVTVAR